jgi:hypothetical protein
MEIRSFQRRSKCCILPLNIMLVEAPDTRQYGGTFAKYTKFGRIRQEE